ncbi:DUF805 domain-containing protein [Gemella haemolysans]|uniref:Uncharacterized protein n=1 Tax=Gemella haemolysans ATCC 10379 TaxID=546270 RepID=C5NWM2_9BACL|nr:DUF805 domain-containing protein [Gemella haemolysans]EER68491.1 hypothetical protein GEMHA0001_1162 [Gemella haemolysans ATCC 10379]KAA8706393.1 DUF805 domain-containing protein [Gemella haemolysans]UBH82252.1 DUF805 domain-containing protein [Gemella haemolysans]
MIDQRRKHVTYGSSFKDFFKGFVDFTGYTSVSGHWFPVGSILGGLILLTVIVFQGMFSSITSIGRKSSRSSDYLLSGGALSDGVSTLQTGLAFGIFILIAGLILILPLTASFTRRLRDVGFATWGIVILIALYYILSYFSVYLLTPVYAIVFFFVLMSLPSNAVETNSNSEFARFFLRQTPQAQQYYSQFANPFGQPVQYDQFGNPIPNQPQFNNGMNQGFQGQAPQGFNPNAPQGRPQQGFQGQTPQGFNPNAPQGRPQQGFQGQVPQGFNPNAPQGRPQQGFQGQAPQGFNPNAQHGGQPQGFNPNAQHGGQPQGFNPNAQHGGQPQGFNPNAQHGGQPQGFNPNAQHGGQPQGFNPNTQHGGQPQGFNPNAQQGVQEQAVVNEVQEEQQVQASQEVNVAPEQHVEVAPQVETAPVVETPAPQVEETHQVETVAVAGGARSRRLQKLNRAEEDVAFKKRR